MTHLLYQTEASKAVGRTPLFYAERIDYRERWTEGSNELSRTIAVPWSQRWQLVKDFVGTAAPVNSLLVRTLPEFHPDYFWMPCVAMDMINPQGFAVHDVDKMGVEFASGSEGLAVFRATHANVQYRILANNAIGDPPREILRWTHIRETYQTERQGVNGGTWTLVDFPDQTIQAQTQISYHVKEVRLTWFRTPAWDRASIEGLLNKVNDAAWPNVTQNFIVYNYAPHTLLFSGAEFEEKRSSAGQLLWDITFIFKWRGANGANWNKFYYAGTANAPGFYLVTAANGNPPYASGNFENLFFFDVPGIP